MNVLKGNLNRKEMCRFLGVESGEVDKSLAIYHDLGYITYEKIGSKYHFVLFGKPVDKIFDLNIPG